MDKNDTHQRSAAEQPKKSVQELENPEVKGRILIPLSDYTFTTNEGREIDVTEFKVEFKIHANTESNSLFVKPKISGFSMSRKV